MDSKNEKHFSRRLNIEVYERYLREIAIPPLFNSLEVLSSASDKAKLFAQNVLKNSNLDD